MFLWKPGWRLRRQGQHNWCSKTGFYAAEGDENPSIPTQVSSAPLTKGKRKLTDEQRRWIAEKRQELPNISQLKIAELAAKEFGLENLVQNTVSRIVSDARQTRQSGIAQRKEIPEYDQRNPGLTQNQVADCVPLFGSNSPRNPHSQQYRK